jgi:transcriptional regulator with PAS, ATPase and Fis domain
MNIPPLRERKDDISVLVEHFIRRFSSDNGKEIEGLSSEAMDVLLKYNYPGNVRELENIIERAAVVARDSVISVRDLPFKDISSPLFSEYRKVQGPMKDSVEALEHQMIEEAMERARQNQSKAAEMLGITEGTLRYKLKKYGLKE